jgi:hypothetical protein
MFYVCSRVYSLQDEGNDMPDSFAKCIIPFKVKGTSKTRTAAAKSNVKTEIVMATDNDDESSLSESDNEFVDRRLPTTASKRSPTAKHLIYTVNQGPKKSKEYYAYIDQHPSIDSQGVIDRQDAGRFIPELPFCMIPDLAKVGNIMEFDTSNMSLAYHLIRERYAMYVSLLIFPFRTIHDMQCGK